VQPGYVLFAPITATNTYLIDNEGCMVHQWPSAYVPGQSVYLIPTGTLLRTAALSNAVFHSGGEGGRVEKIDWSGHVVWAYDYSTTQVRQHHDIEQLPNGHIVMIAWEYRTAAQAIAAGRDPTSMSDGELWPDHVIEVAPTGSYGGKIVWEWHIWDHLIQDYDNTKANYGVVSNHTELININYISGSGADWTHVNSVAYNPSLDQLILSSHNFSEFWVIDHSTTPSQAAGHTGGRYGRGGDLLYRWGNPAAYNAGSASDQVLFGQHNVHWIPPGYPGENHLLIFNNGYGRPGPAYTTIDEIIPPMDVSGVYTQQPDGSWGPSTTYWSYAASPRTDFYSDHISGAQRQPNGNTLICDGQGGHLFEVTPDSNIVWSYEVPIQNDGSIIRQGKDASGNRTFRAERYLTNTNYFTGLDLTPSGPIELYSAETDFDGDGIEDVWEINYHLNPALATDGPEDPDGDGASNLAEYTADTDPTNSLSYFHLAEISRDTTNMLIMFSGSSNRIFSLQQQAGPLDTGSWMTVAAQSGIPGAGTGATTTLYSAITTNIAACRVFVERP